MRLKKVKGAGDRINNSPYVIKEPILFKGKYQELFNNSNPLKIEIGMGKGDFIIESAKQYPHINFIGIEKFDSVMVRAIEKLEYLELDNLKLIKMDGLSIDAVFDHEIDTIYLNFSDPWPKKRHQNRRLTSSIFLEKYEQVFKKTKRIVMKTDNRKLFEYSIISFNQHNYKIKDISLDLYDDDIKDNIPTEYEKKFVSKGIRIYKIKVTKN
ncbi:MAG: tRNA (guanosine(46)-N7)-methyltransferase TrmB [Bacilli bacterium]|nr:tRNA (guanosine(46)-N7)-methyltransferase TrmB [Bacilli bacterium]